MTSAVDQYRIAALNESNFAEVGVAFTDVTAAASLAKIAEGGVTSYRELEAAEICLQALLLHERVHVLTYGPKVKQESGMIGYVRQDERPRSEFAFGLMDIASGKDRIVCPEFLSVENGRIASSTSAKSPLVGTLPHQLSEGKPYWSEDVEDAINVTIEMHGVPAYLTNPALVRSRAGEGFAKDFYTRIRQPWDKAVESTPKVVCTFSPPPLLTIVLDRLTNREDLLAVLSQLRTELASVRQELRDFDKLWSRQRRRQKSSAAFGTSQSPLTGSFLSPV